VVGAQVFTRPGTTWTEQGLKLVGSGARGVARSETAEITKAVVLEMRGFRAVQDLPSALCGYQCSREGRC
jgi:hypothetical protein